MTLLQAAKPHLARDWLKNQFKLYSRSELICFALWLASLPIFSAFKRAISGDVNAGTFIVLAVFALVGWRLRKRDMTPSIRIMLIGIGFVFTFYSIFGPLSLPESALGRNELARFALNEGRVFMIFFAIASLRFPGLAAVPLSYAFLVKSLYVQTTGIPVSRTDWIIVWDVAAYLILFSAFVSYFRTIVPRPNRQFILNFAILGILAVHFGNYFYSGLAKLMLPPYPTTWLLENPTYQLIAAAWQTGTYPLAHLPSVGAAVYAASKDTVLLINAGTLLAQLATIIALARVKWQQILSLVFDVQHIVIFILTGIFFWKWIALNTLFIIALSKMESFKITVRCYVALVCLLVASPIFFHIVGLAWYDSKIIVDAYVQATTDDGRVLRLPSNFGLTHSVTFAQSRFQRPYFGHATTGSLGKTKNVTVLRTALTCEEPGFELPAFMMTNAYGPDRAALKKSVISTMRYIEENDFFRNNIWNVNLYAHHMVSNPFLYLDLFGLKAKDITSLTFEIETVCASVGNTLNSKVLKRTSVPIAYRKRAKWIEAD